MSATLASRPSRFIRTPCAELSIRPGGLALAQYTISPAPIPKRTWPSGHRGAGLDAARAAAGGVSLGVKSFLPPDSANDLPPIRLLPSRAALPSIVTASPSFNESDFHPALFSSMRLSHSDSQVVILPLGSATSMSTKT